MVGVSYILAYGDRAELTDMHETGTHLLRPRRSPRLLVATISQGERVCERGREARNVPFNRTLSVLTSALRFRDQHDMYGSRAENKL